MAIRGNCRGKWCRLQSISAMDGHSHSPTVTLVGASLSVLCRVDEHAVTVTEGTVTVLVLTGGGQFIQHTIEVGPQRYQGEPWAE